MFDQPALVSGHERAPVQQRAVTPAKLSIPIVLPIEVQIPNNTAAYDVGTEAKDEGRSTDVL